MPAASTPAPSAGTSASAAAGTQADPLDSPRWEDMRKTFFADAKVVFDERVRVSGPAVAEDSLNVPVSVDASGLPGVEELIVFADFNPIVKALRFEPGAAQPSAWASASTAASPRRCEPPRARPTACGMSAAPGSPPPAAAARCRRWARARRRWQERLNEVDGKLWPRVQTAASACACASSTPMDTGLAAGIPAFALEDIVITDAEGRTLSRIQPLEPVYRDPSFTARPARREPPAHACTWPAATTTATASTPG